ncbi:CHASE2 domain-containing protein [Nostoc sp. FACHB-152]|uniref:sensor histidine kinase n=1 Tax=Nostoc sp. FACHB-152 TaxID=2692837 RepID=UPI001682A7A7|nr:CHASE2 domain-containing protein [Nostoc sp. FACHB-152]MBD2451773.1 CHASE2 domain-containing protein [Nostoc sp. FACHB-152]
MRLAFFRQNNLSKKLYRELKLWREVVLPGLSVVGIIIFVRSVGLLQSQEWLVFDQLLRLRPNETVDQRVVIVGIDEDDINYVGKFPIPDQEIAQMLNILNSYQPRVIGLDLFRDKNDSANAELAPVWRQNANIIGIEVALNRKQSFNVKPPPELPPQRVGFADTIVDPDGKLRRGLIASKTYTGELKYSLPLRLAQFYLDEQGLKFEHGRRSYDPIKFGSSQLVRFLPNSGGYVRTDANGFQMLLNFRSHSQPFRTISLREILNKKVDPNWIRDRVVIVGMTAPSVKDSFIISAVKNTLYTTALGIEESSNQYQWIYGVEFHAHATSQIISHVLDNRPLLKVWLEIWEYLWILAWGLLGIIVGLILQSPAKTLLSLGVISIGLVGICYISLIFGWWIPVVPTLLALTSAGLTTFFFDRDLRTLLEQRSLTLKRSFEAIHNGPLQSLAVILRSLGEEEIETEKLRSQLEQINRELRAIPEYLSQEMLSRNQSVYLEGKEVLDLQTPIAEMLYYVYEITLRRNFQGFTTIQSFIPPNFEPLAECHLNLNQKRELYLFLQEALCNVGKHSQGATRLDVMCTRSSKHYCLQIIDNGIAILTKTYQRSGQGTKQAQDLARQLKGKFRRYPNSPQGTICELTWPIVNHWWQNFFYL